MDIDVVITYVNDRDPKWIKEYKSRYHSNNYFNRYLNYDTLSLQVQLIRKYMSYVKNIFVVVSTTSQVKGIDIKDAIVVTHDQIIPNKFLPTFNSCTIEMFLHKIPNLSEHFIYFNDDMYPISFSTLEDFYESDKICMSFKEVPKLDPSNVFRVQCKNSCDAAKKLNSVPLSENFIKPDHICLLHTKSSYERVWSEMSDEIYGSITPRRDKRNFNQYLFALYNFYSGGINIKKLDYIFYDSKTKLFNDALEIIKSKDHKFICINDIGLDAKSIQENKSKLIDAFVQSIGRGYIKYTNNLTDKLINVVIVHYNTPILTECLIKSIRKYTPNTYIYIFDNSDQYPFTQKFDNLKVINNTKGQIINFNRWLNTFPDKREISKKINGFGSAKHAYTIEYCINHIKDDFVLMDSDIIIKRDFSDIVDNRFIFVGGIEEVWKNRYAERVAPYICYINAEMCKQLDIHFINTDKMVGLHSSDKTLYDTGASFLEEVKFKNTIYRTIDYKNYIEHYRGGSWLEGFDKANNKNGKRHIYSPEKWLLRLKDHWFIEEEIYVTMTSWSKRLSNLPQVWDTIINQTRLPKNIILNLSIEEFPSKEHSLPKYINDYILEHPIIKINWVKKNNKQWKKVIPTLFKYPNDCIICIDDDRLYKDPEFIDKLWKAHLRNPLHPITINSWFKYRKKYVQHCGHGTLDKAEFYNYFNRIDLQNIQKFVSSDTFFTYVSNKTLHPIISEGSKDKSVLFNEIEPLSKTQRTKDKDTMNNIWSYLTILYGSIE